MEAMFPPCRKRKTEDREGTCRARRETVWPAWTTEWLKMVCSGRAACLSATRPCWGERGERGGEEKGRMEGGKERG